MKKALITGGAGFIGFHLARRLLADGVAVDVVDDFSRGARDEAIERLAATPRARVLSADLLDPAALGGLGRDYTHVIHMAAILGVANVLERPYAVLRDNVAMLNQVLDFSARLERLERLVFPSTSEVYAGTLEHFRLPIPTPEDTPLALPDLSRPRTSYMLSKIYGEALCHQARLPYTIVRLHNVYGPRMGLKHVVPELLQRAHRAAPGGELEVFSADHTRTFCYVDDAVEMILRLAEAAGGRDGTFNVGTSTGETTIRELAEIVIRVVGKPLVIRPGPTTPGSPARRCPDITRAVAVAGCEPSVALEDGVRRTFAWYCEQVFDRPDALAPGRTGSSRAGSD
ncbi:MAG TPA: NAD-dependent epimerase/dehydratase family protein [Candidatus Eisenbacteria bacterium]